MCAERIPILVVPADLAHIRVFVPWVTADDDHRDDIVVVEGVQTVCVTDSRIGNEFTDVQHGQAMTEIGKVVGHDGPLIGVRRVQRAVGYPGGVELIVTEKLRVAAVAIDIAREKGFPHRLDCCRCSESGAPGGREGW